MTVYGQVHQQMQEIADPFISKVHVKFHHVTPKAIEINDNTANDEGSKNSLQTALTLADTVYIDTTTKETQLDAVETTTANFVTENSTSVTIETP